MGTDRVCRSRVDGGRITALTLAIKEGWDGRTFVIGETNRPDEPSGRQVLGSAIAAVLAALADADCPWWSSKDTLSIRTSTSPPSCPLWPTIR